MLEIALNAKCTPVRQMWPAGRAKQTLIGPASRDLIRLDRAIHDILRITRPDYWTRTSLVVEIVLFSFNLIFITGTYLKYEVMNYAWGYISGVL